MRSFLSTPPEATLKSPDYAIIAMVQGSLGEPGITLGTKGQCRFCGQTEPRAFRNVAHTLPEAFGNKWVTSLDECDACNARFGMFDERAPPLFSQPVDLGDCLSDQ